MERTGPSFDIPLPQCFAGGDKGLGFKHHSNLTIRIELEVSVEGLEPSTNGLKGHCSAIELHALKAKCILSRIAESVNER